MNHLDDQLYDFALGHLEGEALTTAARHVFDCAQCHSEVKRIQTEAALMSAELLESVTPSDSAFARLDAALNDEGKCAPFIATLAHLSDVTAQAMRDIVSSLDDLTRWGPGPGEGITIFHVDGGARTAGCIVGFVKVPAGLSFPEHTHAGDEVSLVVSGQLIDSLGRSAEPGDMVVRNAGTTHVISAGPDEDLVFLVVVDAGVTIDGDLIGPDDPRI